MKTDIAGLKNPYDAEPDYQAIQNLAASVPVS